MICAVSGLHISENGCILHFLSFFLPDGWNVVVMSRAAAAILDQEVDSMGREWQSIKKEGAWVSHAALPALHNLYLKSLMREWSHGFSFEPLSVWSYNWFLN